MKQIRIEPQGEKSVLSILAEQGVSLYASCGGRGVCGSCRIRVISGDAGAVCSKERDLLTEDELRIGIRLACSVTPSEPLTVVSAGEISSEICPIPHYELPNFSLPGFTENERFVCAADLGTTSIRLSVLSVQRGERIGAVRFANPQAHFGADILTRLCSAHNSEESLRIMQNSTVSSVESAIVQICGEGIKISDLTIVGNSAMLAIIAGTGIAELLEPRKTRHFLPSEQSAEIWRNRPLFAECAVQLCEPFEGFAGSDLFADLLASRLTERTPGSLLIDIGTNTELALWDGTAVWYTSVPGGSSFETGNGIRYGTAAVPGAVCSVRYENEIFHYDTVDNGEACGICGSGLIDAAAELLKAGIVRPSGRFAKGPYENGIRIDPSNERTALYGSDIDALQRTKASIASAVEVLLEHAGLEYADLTELVLCGTFGRRINLENAAAIGVIPKIAKIELIPDASLAGAEIILWNRAVQSEKIKIPPCRAVHLAELPEESVPFMENLILKPIQSRKRNNL